MNFYQKISYPIVKFPAFSVWITIAEIIATSLYPRLKNLDPELN